MRRTVFSALIMVAKPICLVTFFAIVYEISKSVIPLSNSVIMYLDIGFEWVIPYVIPYEGYLVAMQFLDLTGRNCFVFSLTLLDSSF